MSKQVPQLVFANCKHIHLYLFFVKKGRIIVLETFYKQDNDPERKLHKRTEQASRFHGEHVGKGNADTSTHVGVFHSCNPGPEGLKHLSDYR